MHSETRTACLMLAMAALASRLPAQGIQCTAGAPINPLPILRAEGITEQVPPIPVNCTGGTPTPAGQPVPTVNIRAQLNATVTNRLLSATGGSLTDALLMIGNPTSANQNIAKASPATGQSFTGTLLGTGTGINFASGSVPNVFLASINNVNGVQWSNIPFDLSPGGITLTFSNIRVNASALSVKDVTITGSFTGDLARALALPQITVATVKPGLNISVVTGNAPNNVPYNPGLLSTPQTLPATPSFYMNYSENFPNVFKTRTSAFQDVPDGYYNTTEAGYTHLGYTDPAGIADLGTRLRATLTNIPTGTSIFVPAVLLPGQAAVQANLVSPGTVRGTTVQLPVTNGSATAVYEVVNSDPSAIETYKIPAYINYNSGVAAPTSISVAPSFASVSGGAQFVNPFTGLTPLPLLYGFTINSATGSTPKLSGTVDSRTCTVGEPVSDSQNSCSPGQSPQVSVYTDSSPALPSFSAATTGGVIITATPSGSTPPNFSPQVTAPGAASGTFRQTDAVNLAATPSSSTPANFSLQVTAPGAAPGTYQQTLQFSAPGAGNTLTLNFPVTVLPANNPIVKPGGITDAFSFQSGTVSPGQPFALFGLNFGPPPQPRIRNSRWFGETRHYDFEHPGVIRRNRRAAALRRQWPTERHSPV